MRIVHVMKHASRYNGHVHLAVDLACAQADAGHDVTFASTDFSFEDLLLAHGVRVVDVPSPSGARGALLNTWHLLRLARRVRPDVIHAHMMSSAVIGAVVRTVLRIPLVTTVHNSFDNHSKLMRLGSAVVAISKAEARLLLNRGFSAGSLHTVLNGVLGSARDELPRDDIGDLERPSIVTLCGLHERKGLRDVLSAFATVSEDFPQWHLSMIGAGPDGQILAASVRELGLEGRVHLVGGTETPSYLLRQAQIYVSAALAEPFSLSTAEARVAGCAVVATDVGGVPEVVEGGRAGLLVPPADPAALAGALRSLMSDPAVLEEWQSRAKAGVEWLSVHRMAREYIEVYRSVVRCR